MADSNIVVDIQSGGLGRITLNRPDDGNMFTAEMCHEIRDCINDIRRETRTRVVVITGAGISAESGLDTYRGAGGIWDQHDVNEVATGSAPSNCMTARHSGPSP